MAQKRKEPAPSVEDCFDTTDMIGEMQVTPGIAREFAALLPNGQRGLDLAREARAVLRLHKKALSSVHRAWRSAIAAFHLFTMNQRDDDEANREAAKLLHLAHAAESRYLVHRVFHERVASLLEGLVFFSQSDNGGLFPWSRTPLRWTSLLGLGPTDTAHPARVRNVFEADGAAQTSYLFRSEEGVLPAVVLQRYHYAGLPAPQPRLARERSETRV